MKKSDSSSSSPATSLRGSGQKYAQLVRSKGPTGISFFACGTVALEAIDAVIDEGDAIILSRTSDGGAIAVTILSGKDRVKEYAGSQAELDAMIDVLKSQ